MPPPERVDLRQRAVLWSKTGRDRYDNSIVEDVPVEIPVRWSDQQAEMMDPQGNTITVDATAIVNQDIVVGSQMWQGSLNDLPGTGYMPETGLMEVKAFNKTPDIKNRVRRRTVGLLRYRLPATAE